MILYISELTSNKKEYIHNILHEEFPGELIECKWLVPPINVLAYYNDIRTILEASTEEIYVVAHSMGAFMILSLYPEFKHKISGIHLINPLIDIDKEYWLADDDTISIEEYQNLKTLPQPMSLIGDNIILPIVIYQANFDERIDKNQNKYFALKTKSRYYETGSYHRFTTNEFLYVIHLAKAYILLPSLNLNLI